MSVIFSASLFFMSFVPLWISILFIDVKSIVTGGEIRTEVISIIAFSEGSDNQDNCSLDKAQCRNVCSVCRLLNDDCT